MRKLLKRLLYFYLRLRGFKTYMANHFAKLLTDDIFDSKISFRDKLWAYKHGFLSCRFSNYKMTKENYKDYLSDYDYFKMYPLNGRERIWIDDKLTTKYVFAPFDEFFPAYYFMLRKGKVTGLHNVDFNKEYSIDDVIELLTSSGVLALKMEAASLAIGFYKVEYKNEQFFVNNKEMSRSDIKSFLSELDNYLVMEYITAHNDIRKYYGGATGVLRVMVINEGKPIIANAYIRVGSTTSGVIDAKNGCVISVVDVETGEYGKESFIENGSEFDKIDVHPDSNIPFAGIIPKWDFVKQKVLEMSSYVPNLTYLGFDVCVTEDGLKIYEINSHQGIVLFQLSYPLLKDNPASDFFKSHLG